MHFTELFFLAHSGLSRDKKKKGGAHYFFFYCVSVPKKCALELVVDLCCGYILCHPGDNLQTVRTLGTGRLLPLVAICTGWRADQALYGTCTIGIYNDVVIHKIHALGGEARGETAALGSYLHWLES